MFAARQKALLESMGPGVMIVPAAPEYLRNNDVEHEFRQSSDLHYLLGFDEPESVLLLSNVHPEHKAVLFLRTRDPERETWDGPRVGVERAQEVLGVDAAFPIAELDAKLPDYLENVTRVHYRLGLDLGFDARFLRAIDVVRKRSRRGVNAPTEIIDPAASVHEQRMVKGTDELELMRKASHITGAGHLAAMRAAKPGRFEYELEAELLRAFRAGGAERAAYGSIVGSGVNATILHYRKNDRQMQDGDLVLIDAGAEYAYYASDVTRTFPVNGRFSGEQRAIYEVVLSAQQAAIAAVRPGATLDQVHEVAVATIVDGLLDLGLLEGDKAEVLESGSYKTFYMHRTGHWLGMDVHDVGRYHIDSAPRPLEPGFVLTVEPGLYVPAAREAVPERFRGIGVRIEDDILVTATGHESLTSHIPKQVEDVEAAVRDGLAT